MGQLCKLVVVAAAAVAGSGCASGPPPTSVTPSEPPSLVLLVTIDQMRPDYFDRFESQLQGGLSRLWREGVRFTNAHHDHAITETAPGHATLLTGRLPKSTGITRNLAGVNDPRWPVLESRDLGAAPFRLRGTTVFDWMAARDPATRALSASAKDRSAILPVGQAKQHVYWFTNNGLFSTSTWYRDTLPSWVSAFNQRRIPHSFAGRAWTTLRAPADYPERDSVPYEAFGRRVTFPHQFPADTAAAVVQFRFTPFVDELTLGFALEGLRTLDLGRGPTTDLLAVSLSGTDYVGHFYGPESQEQHDQIVRLDRVLGAFLDTLFTLRDPRRVLIVVSADHGGGLIPELHGNARVDWNPALTPARALVRAGGGDTTALDFESGALFLDVAKLGQADANDVIEAFLKAAKANPAVLRADRYADLARLDLTKDDVARRWLNMFPDDMRPVAVLTLRPGNIFDYPIVATHGSPHPYDSHVPLIFWGAGLRPGRFNRSVRTVDIAPTLARLLRLTPAESLDGTPLREITP